jgi:hypothetical protein
MSQSGRELSSLEGRKIDSKVSSTCSKLLAAGFLVVFAVLRGDVIQVDARRIVPGWRYVRSYSRWSSWRSRWACLPVVVAEAEVHILAPAGESLREAQPPVQPIEGPSVASCDPRMART